ncbi:hypothetical protein VVR12_03185 [Rothia sp. LK2588]|uniref:hypothetical protein n=1 Tax=Rothia sp. LK2588 TaxID=3114369 RepID=UPI0034CEEAA1
MKTTEEILAEVRPVEKAISAVLKELGDARVTYFVNTYAPDATKHQKTLAALNLLTTLDRSMPELNEHRDSLETLLAPLRQSVVPTAPTEEQGPAQSDPA